MVNPDDWAAIFSNQLQENVEKTSSLPYEIIVKKKELFAFLGPVTSKLGIKLTMVSDLNLIDHIRKDMHDFPMDKDEMFEDVIELLMEDESFQALMEEGSLEDLMKKGSIHALLKDESIHSLIEKKRKERSKAPKENEYAPEQTTLSNNLNSDQSKQREFVDLDHKAMDDYHKLLQEELGMSKLKIELEKLIKKDPDFFDSYLTLFEILKGEGRQSEAEKCWMKPIKGNEPDNR